MEGKYFYRKVLVVDDVREWITKFERALTPIGIRVLGDASMSQDSIEEIFERNYIHIAFIDIEKSGEAKGFRLFDIIKRLSPFTVLIILSHYAHKYSKEIINKLSYPSVASLVYSKEHIEEANIQKDVKKMFDSQVKINFDIEIEAEDSYFDFKLDNNEKINYEEVYNLIGMLFYGNSEIKRLSFSPLSGGKSNANVFRIVPYVTDEIIANKYRPINNVVLKIGPRNEIHQESNNFDKYVRWYLKDKQRVNKIRYRESSNKLGGILYTFAGTKTQYVKKFSDIIKDDSMTSDKLYDLICSIFDPNAQDWYSHRIMETKSIFDEYSTRIGIAGDNASRLDDFLLNKRPKDLKLKFLIDKDNKTDKDYIVFNEKIKLKNPIKYALEKNLFINDKYQSCIIHGDLNGENILLNENLDWILIDYFKVARGHVFDDFICLEVSIRARILSDKISMETLYDMELSIFDDLKNKSFARPELQKAFIGIKTIRQKALENFTENDQLPVEPLKNYYIGLLYRCLHTFRHNIKPNNKQHILML